MLKLKTNLTIIYLNARMAQCQTDYKEKYQHVSEKLSEWQRKLATLDRELRERITQRERLARFVWWVKNCENPLSQFDMTLWIATMDIVMVYDDGRLVFRFKDGSEVMVGVLNWW